MTIPERRYGVSLYRNRIGTLNQRGDHTWFRFTDEYLADANRDVLGLVFENDLTARHAKALRLPPWFSNLLPEGRLREWIALERGVSMDREMELLAQVGRDLPGAVTVFEEEGGPEGDERPQIGDEQELEEQASTASTWRFSLAGVGLKFSMLKHGDRLSMPASGSGGEWIVKLPDQLHAGVPVNEHAMMTMASKVGIEVPEILLLHRDEIDGLPAGVWPDDESYAYAVRRFDRPGGGELVHIEDFAQVRNVLPYGDGKYQGNFETVAALAYRQRDTGSLQEVARRIAFNILISNGDAHLKNWSLIYRDRRTPTLSPVYDLVSTAHYAESGHAEDLGLKFGGTRRFDRVSLGTFRRLEQKLKSTVDLVHCVEETVRRVQESWPEVEPLLSTNPDLRSSIKDSIARHSTSLLRG